MFCQNCGQEIPDDSRFCDYCGQPQQVYDGQEQENSRDMDRMENRL